MKPNKAEHVLFPVVFGIIWLLVSLEPTVQFQWGFLQNVDVKMMQMVS